MKDLSRRQVLKLAAASSTALAGACTSGASPEPSARIAPPAPPNPTAAASSVTVTRLDGMNWETTDPFLFCVHHDDHYPAGNAAYGPAASLEGRELGMDFEAKDGFRMYHGRVVPGFPQHPHRGFETVTVVRRGLLDHSDSLGAAARYGEGDVQWLTAGSGIQHAEMFPLLRRDRPNPVELFQIWLNLPAANKMVDPHFTMLWSQHIPTERVLDERGRGTAVTVIAGDLGSVRALSPPPNSWAAVPSSAVAIWTLHMDPGARFTLPKSPGAQRSLYFFAGAALRVAERTVPVGHRVEMACDADIELLNGDEKAELLVLQGRPIGEPIARRGPFVMNTETELRRAYADYQATEFGGWPWPTTDPVHGPKGERFARRPDGRVEKPG